MKQIPFTVQLHYTEERTSGKSTIDKKSTMLAETAYEALTIFTTNLSNVISVGSLSYSEAIERGGLPTRVHWTAENSLSEHAIKVSCLLSDYNNIYGKT